MTPSEIDDVIARVLAGEREAFRLLFDDSYVAVRIAIAVRAPDAELVDEVVQQSFVAAFEDLHNYQAGRSFTAWVIGIARHCLTRALHDRSRKRSLAERIDETLSLPAEEESWPPLELVERLNRCLDLLTPAARRLADLRFRDGHQVAAISASLGRSAASISTTLYRIRAALRTCLEQDRG